MKLLGAEIVPVVSGAKTLKDAMNDALRDWGRERPRHLLLHRHGSRGARTPPLSMVRDFQSVIGRETRATRS